MKQRWRGLIFIMCADLLWGLSAVIAKFLFNNQVNAFDLAQLRITLAFILLFCCLLAFNRPLLKVQKHDYLYMIIFGIAGMSAVQFSYMFTISQTNVATAVFLQYLAPVFILLYAFASGREEINILKVISIATAIIGGFLMVKGSGSEGLAISKLGLTVGLASAVFFAFYTIYGKYGLGKYSPWTMLCWGMGAGSIVWCIYRWPWQTLINYSLTEWGFFFYMAIFATIIPFGLFFKGLHLLTPVITGVTSTIEPVLSAILAFLILGEALTGWQIIGSVLIILAITLLQTIPNKSISA
ncbi:MAG: DMT family transporter [Methylocystaceae bacterium]